jgi:hypothetical protein
MWDAKRSVETQAACGVCISLSMRTHARGRSVGRSLTSSIAENGTHDHEPHAKVLGNKINKYIQKSRSTTRSAQAPLELVSAYVEVQIGSGGRAY